MSEEKIKCYQKELSQYGIIKDLQNIIIHDYVGKMKEYSVSIRFKFADRDGDNIINFDNTCKFIISDDNTCEDILKNFIHMLNQELKEKEYPFLLPLKNLNNVHISFYVNTSYYCMPAMPYCSFIDSAFDPDYKSTLNMDEENTITYILIIYTTPYCLSKFQLNVGNTC